MTEKRETEMLSRRKAFSFLGLAALSLAAAPTLLMTSEDAEAQTTAAPTPQTGPERRQERRGQRQQRRQERRTARTERRTERRTNRAERRTQRREGRTERRQERRGTSSNPQ